MTHWQQHEWIMSLCSGKWIKNKNIAVISYPYITVRNPQIAITTCRERRKSSTWRLCILLIFFRDCRNLSVLPSLRSQFVICDFLKQQSNHCFPVIGILGKIHRWRGSQRFIYTQAAILYIFLKWHTIGILSSDWLFQEGVWFLGSRLKQTD